MTLREAILSINDVESEKILIPEWNVTVEIRGMTAAGRARMFEIGKNSTEADSRWHLIYSSVYDPETGLPVFQKDDKDAVMQKSAESIDAILNAIYRINGWNETAIEDSEKNL